MNAWATAILWGMLQVTLLTAFGLVLYLAARRRGPAAGSLVSVGTLIAVLTLTILAIAPLPASWNASQAWNAVAAWSTRNTTTEEPLATNNTTTAETPTLRPVVANSPSPLGVTEFWTAFVDEMRRAPVEQSGAPRRWPIVVLALFGLGAGLGLFRLFAGATAVRSYRRHSRPIADANLFRLVQTLRQDTGCRADVEIRETSRLGTPATVGCFAPLVLLPTGWRDWSRDELRAVLAHEIAHVARGDFLAGLVAQVTLALHFYHPLVHWLVGRLRLEQELAADATGMQASGGRDSYLVTLAGMALRQDDLAVSWAARPFLPTRGTFMRRIEMLRDSRKQVSASLPRGGRGVLIGALVAAGLVVAGLRPGEMKTMLAQPQATDRGTATLFELSPGEQSQLYLFGVSPEAKLAVAARPAAMLAKPEMAPLAKMLKETIGAEFDVSVDQLEQVTLSLVDIGEASGPATCIVLTHVGDYDWKPLIAKLSQRHPAKEVNFGRFNYLRLENHPDNLCIDFSNSRSILIQPEKALKKYLAWCDEVEGLAKAGKEPPKGKWSALWKNVANGQAAVAIDSEFVRAEMERMPAANAGPMSSFAPLWKESETAVLGIGLGDGTKIEGYLEASSADAAQRIAKTLEAAKTLFQNQAPQLRNQIINEPAETAGLALQALDAATKIIDSAKLSTNDKLVELHAEGPGDIAATMAIIMPAIAQAREAARRVQSMNNLKQIGLAMHVYADTHKSFPPAVIIGPDGKTPHSWRVAILPYIEQDALYRQYKLDEPWDSENNKKVLEQMPAVYRHPSDDRSGFSSSYFVLTGESTVFNGTKGAGFAEILDGISNTILAVEAKRDIPWTKPEDIPYEPNQPLPELGGFTPQGFNAGYCDGSVRYVAQAIDSAILRALITKADGEHVGPDSLIPDAVPAR